MSRSHGGGGWEEERGEGQGEGSNQRSTRLLSPRPGGARALREQLDVEHQRQLAAQRAGGPPTRLVGRLGQVLHRVFGARHLARERPREYPTLRGWVGCYYSRRGVARLQIRRTGQRSRSASSTPNIPFDSESAISSSGFDWDLMCPDIRSYASSSTPL